MRSLLGTALLAAAPYAVAAGEWAGSFEAVLASRTIRPGDVIAPADVRLGPSPETAGALVSQEDAVGMIARRLLVSGQPIREGDVGPAALVRRNEHVAIFFERGMLSIRAEGRALSEGAVGERIRVMNLGSRQTLTGTVAADGSVEVGYRE